MKPTVFIGSSSEQIEIAEAIEVNLTSIAEVTSWKHAFKPGRPFLNDLSDMKNKFDFAVLVLTPDDILISRDNEFLSPRDNVIFELGLFIGSIGNERVYAVSDENINTKIFSDYLGVSYLTYDGNRKDKDLNRALSPTCIKIKNIIKKLGRIKRPPTEHLDLRHTENSLIGLEKIYPTYAHAESDLLNELKITSGPVRLFLQIAAQNIGLKGSLFDLLHDLSSKKSVELRILHTSETSPLFSRDRLISMGKNPDRIITTIRYVNKSLRDLELESGTSLRHRIHSWPFIWRIYAFDKRLYLMPYYSDKNAVEKSPVLVFCKKESSMYNTFVDWFDFVWEQCSPKEIRISDIITPATPAGTALFIQWKGFHVFGIPKRDLIINSDHIRFYGIGGKRLNPNESWEECALREANEETTNVVEKVLSSHYTHFFRSNGTTEQIKVVNEPKTPRLILEKRKHSGYGSMAKLDDHYYLVAFDAVISKKPKASGEIAALIYLNDYHLSLIKSRSDISIAELVENGVNIEEQNDIKIDRNKILVPHGTAAYLIRQMPE